MAWIPALLLGLDLAAREGRPAGGALAGLAILFAAWGDLHVFFFGALAAPGWVVLALAARGPAGERPLAGLGGVARALVPAAIGLGLALATPLFRDLVYRSVMGAVPVAHAAWLGGLCNGTTI